MQLATTPMLVGDNVILLKYDPHRLHMFEA